MRCSIWRIFIFMSLKLSHVRMLSVVWVPTPDMRVREFAIRQTEWASEWVYLTFSHACCTTQRYMNFGVNGLCACSGTCTIRCVNTHSQFGSHTLILSPHLLSATPFTYFCTLPLSLGTHSVMLFCWFEKFTFTLKWHNIRVRTDSTRTHTLTPCNIKIYGLALPFAHVHYVMIKQQTGIEIW